MSGTIHSKKVLKKIFGLSDFKIIKAETKTPGKITEIKTGKELNCKYENFQKGEITREQYLNALSECIKSSEPPTLIHVNAYKDLPTRQEAELYNLEIMTGEELKNLQSKDNVGEQAEKFKKGEIKILYSTRCNRGVDFPGETCNSIILTKYPYSNISSVFWRILRRTRPQHFNHFYTDKARREFLQKIHRGLRGKDDHIYLLSPDIRVFEALE
jgi:Rad3-related DNA helicase